MESSDWTRLFKGGVYVHDQPDQSVVEFTRRNFPGTNRKRSPVTVLDLGCGYGRHMEFLLKYGVNTVVGLDSSTTALDMAKDKLHNSKSSSTFLLINSDIAQLPFPAGRFDCLISMKVLQHNALPERRLGNVVREMARVLRKKGSLLVTAASTSHREFGVGREIASNTFEILEGRHRGVIQHYFEKEELRRLFEGCGFKVSSINADETSSNLILIGNRI